MPCCSAKSGKAVDPDEIHVELTKLLENDSIDILVNLFNIIYKTGKSYNEYRTIYLMSHVLKIFLKIIHMRIYNKLR